MHTGSITRALARALALISVTASGHALAGEIEGTVTNATLERPARGVAVLVEGTGREVRTDEEGRFRIGDLAAGSYTLRIEQPGYLPLTLAVQVPEQGAVRADGSLALLEGTGGTEIEVIGSRASRLLAIERKRALPVIADVVSSDGIGKLPDYNTAEALQRLPGVSVQIDQGEPRYVIIRGVDPNLNQVTVDGNLVGIPEAEGRRVALDTIPSDLLAAIEVIKAVTPDYDANAIGGSINLVTPTAFDRAAPFTTVTARGAYNGKSEKLGFGGSLTHGRRFGPDETFGIVVAGSYSKRFIDSDLAEPINWVAINSSVSTPTGLRLYDYRIMRERIGTIVNLDWRPDPDTSVYVKTIFNQFTDKEERDRFDFALAGGVPTFPTSTSIRFTNGRATREFRQNEQTQRLFNIAPGGEFRFGSALLSLNYTYARAEERTPIRDDIEFRSPTGRTSTLDLSSNLPRFIDIDARLFDPAGFPLRRIRLRREAIIEDLQAARADLKLDVDPASESFVKLGFKFIDRTKDRDNRQSEQLPTIPTTLAATGAVRPAPTKFYEGRYAYGPTIDYRNVLDFFAANPGRLALNQPATAANDVRLDYRIKERIYAGYAMASLDLGDLTAIGGVRVEHTDGRYNAFTVRDTNRNGTLDPSDFVPRSLEKTYTNVLPSVHLTYRPGNEAVLRAAWTNTIGRPNYDAIVPTFEEDAGIGTAGNPDLEPFKSMGLDLSAEYYADADSIVSLAVFYKRIENPIFTRVLQNTAFAGVPLVSLSQPQNASSGDIFGIEANVVKRFTFLPAPLDGFGISANATYINSSVTVPGREREDIPFFRQPDWIAGGALFYEKGRFEARLAADYRDDFIVNIGDSVASDVYDRARFVLDARISYRIFDEVEIFASASNITDAPLTFFQTSRAQTFSRQIYGANADFGISARF